MRLLTDPGKDVTPQESVSVLRVLSAVDAYALAVPLARDDLEGHLTPATLLLPVSGGVDPFGE